MRLRRSMAASIASPTSITSMTEARNLWRASSRSSCASPGADERIHGAVQQLHIHLRLSAGNVRGVLVVALGQAPLYVACAYRLCILRLLGRALLPIDGVFNAGELLRGARVSQLPAAAHPQAGSRCSGVCGPGPAWLF